MMSRLLNMTKLPIVVVFGVTAGGKSKLAIDIAKRFNGQVINADSLQVYKGLDIVTNKVTEDEMDGVKHHLMNFVDPLTPITVVDWRNRVLPLIDSLLSQKILPVLVGGSHYYIESIIWDMLVGPEKVPAEKFVFDEDRVVQESLKDVDELTEETIFSQPIVARSFPNVSGERLHQILTKIDPESAAIYHPNDKRKIIRALQVIQRHDKKFSDVLKAQNSLEGASSLGGPLRFDNVIMFWTRTEKAVLRQRLDDRVNDMVSRGLLQELDDFYGSYTKRKQENGLRPNYTEGIFQAIGVKEFHNYQIVPKEERTDKLLNHCLTDMKTRTRQYAKSQLKWIHNRFINCNRIVPPIIPVDTTNPSNWEKDVRDPAFRVMESYLSTGTFPSDIRVILWNEKEDMTITEKGHDLTRNNRRKIYFCDVCNSHLQGEDQMHNHLKGRIHRYKKGLKTMSLTELALS